MGKKVMCILCFLAVLAIVGTLVQARPPVFGCHDLCKNCSVYGDCHEITDCCGYCDLGGIVRVYCCFGDGICVLK
jgi:hypothetical protein